MDRPREPHLRRNTRRALIAGAAIVAVVALYAPFKAGALAALESGARVGFGLSEGAPTVRSWLPAENAAQLEVPSTANSPESTSSRSGGLFRPAYTQDGRLRVPEDYAEWVFVGGATGLAYGEDTLPTSRHDDAPGIFTHVYLEPGAFRHFRETGEFPDGTMFALEMREPTTGVSIARDGWFAGASHGVHVAVKDTERYGGWEYFNMGRDGLGRRVRSSSCADCHTEHGAVDNVFVQFYPALTED